MLLKREWADRFVSACAKLNTARRRSLAAGEMVYASTPQRRCGIVETGYVKILDPRADGNCFIRLFLGRGGLIGQAPFGSRAFHRFASLQHEQAVAHGPSKVLELDRSELEAATHARTEFATLLLESLAARTQFLERRLLWQLTTPIRARVAAALRDLICFEGQRCRHGHSIDIRLTHQDLAELVGAARPVVSAELVALGARGSSHTRGSTSAWTTSPASIAWPPGELGHFRGSHLDDRWGFPRRVASCRTPRVRIGCRS